MNVRWLAVITGFMVDTLITVLILSFAPESYFNGPDLSQPTHILIICLSSLSTGVGGYVAGRMARTDRAINGLLVGVVGILFGQLQGSLPRVLVVASAIACLFAALGGYLSRFPRQRTHSTPEQQ
jgi:putative membrane protein (TIGR04086 family)